MGRGNGRDGTGEVPLSGEMIGLPDPREGPV